MKWKTIQPIHNRLLESPIVLNLLSHSLGERALLLFNTRYVNSNVVECVHDRLELVV